MSPSRRAGGRGTEALAPLEVGSAAIGLVFSTTWPRVLLSSLARRHLKSWFIAACCKPRTSKLLAALALFAASVASVHAQKTWIGGPGAPPMSEDWFSDPNWVPTGAPTRFDDVTISLPGRPAVIGEPGAVALDLTVGANAMGTLTI